MLLPDFIKFNLLILPYGDENINIVLPAMNESFKIFEPVSLNKWVVIIYFFKVSNELLSVFVCFIIGIQNHSKSSILVPFL